MSASCITILFCRASAVSLISRSSTKWLLYAIRTEVQHERTDRVVAGESHLHPSFELVGPYLLALFAVAHEPVEFVH